MENLGRSLDEALGREGTDTASIDTIERIRAVLAFAGKRLAGVEPQLLHQAGLDGLSGALQATRTEIAGYISDGDATHVINANTHAENVLAQLTRVNYPFVSDELIPLRDAASAYRRTLEQNLESAHSSLATVRTQASTVQQTLAELTTAIDAEKSKLASVSADFQTKYTTAEEKRNAEATEKVQASIGQLVSEAATVQQRLSELTTEIAAERTRLTTLASDFQSQFSTAQESRGREFTDAQSNRQDKFSTLFNDYTQRLNEQSTDFGKQRDAVIQQVQTDLGDLRVSYAASAQGILDKIQQHRSDVEKLVGVIGNLGVTSGYQKTANHARIATFVWQGITVLAMIGVIVFAYFAFLPITQGTFTWEGFAGRVVLALSVGVLAAYGAAQADKYLEIDRRNRKLALELEAIGPFLAPLPEDKQEAFRLQLGERTFGREETGIGRRAADRSPATIVDVLGKSKEFREFIAEIIKAAKS